MVDQQRLDSGFEDAAANTEETKALIKSTLMEVGIQVDGTELDELTEFFGHILSDPEAANKLLDNELWDFCKTIGLPDDQKLFDETKKAAKSNALIIGEIFGVAKFFEPQIQKVLEYCGCDEATSNIVRQNFFGKNPKALDVTENDIKALWDKIRAAETIINEAFETNSEKMRERLKKKALNQGPSVAEERAKMIAESTTDFQTSVVHNIQEAYRKAGVELPENWLDLPVDQLPDIPGPSVEPG